MPSQCRLYSTAGKRRFRLEEQNRCLLCVQQGHAIENCPSTRTCIICGDRHHFLICENKSIGTGGNSQPLFAKTGNPKKQPNTNTCMVKSFLRPSISTPIRRQTKPPAYLLLGYITVRGQRGTEAAVPVFFDTGSQTSFITKTLVQQIHPRRVGQDDLNIGGFVGGQTPQFKCFHSPLYSVFLG